MSAQYKDSFGIRTILETKSGKADYFSLPLLAQKTGKDFSRLPYSIRVLIEAVARQEDGFIITKEDIERTIAYNPASVKEEEIPFKPARVIMQDFTGVPGVVDLAAMREAVAALGADPLKINPVLPVDLVIDHSVQIDFFGNDEAAERNEALEFDRNRERYEFLRWGSRAFRNFRVVPPATGIVHQVNLEYLATVTASRDGILFPDSLVGTDSHTTMINGLGVVGWGVGGIEAEAVMLDQPIYMLMPEVIGMRLIGKLPDGATATDLVLSVTQILRKRGVVGRFVEFTGPGLNHLSLADRATIANMAPEYGATIGFFPVDDETLRYMRLTGRSEELIDTVERYSKAQGLFRDSSEPEFSDLLELDMSTVEPSLAGPRRPQDRIPLRESKKNFQISMTELFGKKEENSTEIEMNGRKLLIKDGAVVIASITSCTNTSNPSVLIAAGILAKKAVEKGLSPAPWVKTSLAPGSRVVTEYLRKAALLPFLEKIGYNVVGYGCTTCIGNSGPIDPGLSAASKDHDITLAAVLSGNRNFEGRIHADVKANYLASPPLVVAYALAGTMNIDFETDPIGTAADGKPVFLRDLWPSSREIGDAIAESITRSLFVGEYKDVFAGSARWNDIKVSEGSTYAWQKDSTYIREPSFFSNLPREAPGLPSLSNLRVLAVLGDSVTTDHISPAGSIKKDSPAGKWLTEHGVAFSDFNSYGSRRGNHEVMVRGTFANIRIRNHMLPGVEGGFTRHIPSGEVMPIYDAAMKYAAEHAGLMILAGKEYGTGSSRDWAAKGTSLLGVRSVLAESFERIHRSNLIGMGILPLQYRDGESAASYDLTGTETISLQLSKELSPGMEVVLSVLRADGSTKELPTRLRADTPVEIEYLKNGGILQTVLRQLIR